jgi:hypothetical protein
MTENSDQAPRVGTIVWGLIVALVGLSVLALSVGWTVDIGLAVIILLIAGGFALVIGALAGVVRSRRVRE